MMKLSKAWIAAAGMTLACFALQASAAVQAPRIGKPRPAPPGPVQPMPLPPAVIDNNLAIGGDDVKARKSNTRMAVEVHVNGRGPYRFIVDSGADTSAIGLNVARQLQLPLSTPVLLNGMTSRNIVDRVKVDSLVLGPSTIRDLNLPALKEDDLGAQGLVGIDALVRQRLLMDFERRLIKVEDSRRMMSTSPDDIVIIAKRQRGQLILTQVRADNVRLDAVVDTGSEISIGNTALRDKLLRKGRADFFTVPVTGVTGVTVELQLARIKQLQIGSVTLQDVPIAFADVPPFELFGLANEPSLLLGTDLLEVFRRVSLDFRTRKVRFQLRRCQSESVVISTSPMAATRLSGGSEVCNR